LCPDCAKKHYPDYFDDWLSNKIYLKCLLIIQSNDSILKKYFQIHLIISLRYQTKINIKRCSKIKAIQRFVIIFTSRTWSLIPQIERTGSLVKYSNNLSFELKSIEMLFWISFE
jgi:hypothetical protein